MKLYEVILIFGAAMGLMLALLQGLRIRKGGVFSINFAKSFGLIAVASFGSALAVADVADGAKAGAFTLLGTIAGYLAGTKPTGSSGASSESTI